MEERLLTNYSEITFLNSIKQSLAKCKSFAFSVSFIKKAGLVLLIKEIEKALERGANGKIITSTYQNFTDIASLNNFFSLSKKYTNFECHIDYNSFKNCGFHTKGYLFEHKESYEIFVGSSNITRFALLKNIEWNVSLIVKENKGISNNIYNEFNFLWNKTIKLTEEVIKNYTQQLYYAIEKWDMDYDSNTSFDIRPNIMQRKALKEIRRYRDLGVNKALVIAATASGKTYLAAFDAKNFDAQKVLFIVHRDTILHDALKTFQKIFGGNKTYGFFNGENKDVDADFLFSTNISMAKNLYAFTKHEFDYIVLDEVHHAVADTYIKIINHFEPQFLLGLTATPERMDNKSVFDLFEKNVPYELRLRDALENDLVVPFKYYGIRDKITDYGAKDSKKLISQIASNIHCEFVIEEIEKHKPTGNLKAIGFCKSIEQARSISESMNILGYKTVHLTGSDSTGTRIKEFNNLQDENKQLQIIFTVDILNEGIDIPGINMVLFLRPTESSTIFIQQLGRGLRKYKDKEYLTVLDFIGNSYERSVQIALALSSLSNNMYVDKKLLVGFIQDDFATLGLPIEINIDELSKEEILTAIEATNFNNLKFLKQDYNNLKKYLKKEEYLTHMDFLDNDITTDLMRYIKKNKSYYNFLLKVEQDVPLFNEEQIEFIKYLSTFLPLVRPYEFLIVKELIDQSMSYNELLEKVSGLDYFVIERFNHALGNLQNNFYSEVERNIKKQYIIKDNNKFIISVEHDNQAYSRHIKDLLEYGLKRFNIEFNDCNDSIKLYHSYTRATLFLALCNHTFASREGLIWINNELYIFIDLKKDDKKEEYLKYKDEFVNNKILQWESQTGTKMDNSKGVRLIKQKHVKIFVRKIAKEDGVTMPYIYIGKGELTEPAESDNIKKTLLFKIILNNKVPDYLEYDFEIL